MKYLISLISYIVFSLPAYANKTIFYSDVDGVTTLQYTLFHQMNNLMDATKNNTVAKVVPVSAMYS